MPTDLQAAVVIIYPRLNIHYGGGLPHFVMMHLIATNLIIWVRSLMVSTFHEFHDELSGRNHTAGTADLAEDLLTIVSESGSHYDKLHCVTDFQDDLKIKHILIKSSGLIMAFIVEFSVMGCIFFYNTWNHVHTMTQLEIRQYIDSVSDDAPKKRVHKRHNLCAPLARANWSNSTCGMVTGSICLLVTILELIIFVVAAQNNEDDSNNETLEIIGKVVNTLINFLAICSCFVGLIRIQGLMDKDKPSLERDSYDGERFLLNCGVFFIFLYNCLTTAVGAQGKHDNLANDDKRLIHVFQGILETMAAAIQTLFIHQLSIKVCIIIGVLT